MSAKERADKAWNDQLTEQEIRFDVEIITNSRNQPSFFIGEADSVKGASALVRECNKPGIIGAKLHPISDNEDASIIAATHEWCGEHCGFLDMT